MTAVKRFKHAVIDEMKIKNRNRPLRCHDKQSPNNSSWLFVVTPPQLGIYVKQKKAGPGPKALV